MNDKELSSFSKFMSLVLRHDPAKVGIMLDKNGWADTKALLAGINKTRRTPATLNDIKYIVATDNKKRYSFNDDGSRIRANQGHSVQVDVELTEKKPPDVLYHGTAYKNVDSIKREGLQPRSRLYVHLSTDKDTAVIVGKRHGTPKVLRIDAARMYADGVVFYLSANDVWLVGRVGVKYIDFGFEY